MPAKIRTIKAVTYFDANYSSFFEFNKSINYKGETLSQLKLREKNPGVFKVKVFQDLNGDGVMTKSDLIFKGKIKNVEDTDDLTNFLGTIKLTKKVDVFLRFVASPLRHLQPWTYPLDMYIYPCNC